MAPRADLASGRAAYKSGDWAGAYDAFGRADDGLPLSAADLEAWANTAYLLGREHAFESLLDRAHQRYLDRGDNVSAAYCACWLGLSLAGIGAGAQASGWFSRARRLLADVERETVVHGYLKLADALGAVAGGSAETAYAAGNEAVEIAKRFHDEDLSALALQLIGRMLLRHSRRDEGLALLDEAMVAVASGALRPQVAGIVYCSVIDGCRATYSLRRAHEWTEALTRWCEEQPELVAFNGECRVARAEMLVLRGAWHDAIAEAERACERSPQWAAERISAAASYQMAEVFRLRGEFDAADRAYQAGGRAGGPSQPGLALLRLAQGKFHAAERGLDRALEETSEPIQRARLLPAKVSIALATGSRLDEARAAAAELARIAATFGTRALATIADHALGAVALAAGDAVEASRKLRSAAAGWRDLSARYETARVSVLLGGTNRLLGDEEGAQLEFAAARATFEELGARPDLARLAAIAGNGHAASGLTPRELQVLAQLVAGNTNRSIAHELVISERTVDRHVSNIFDKLEVSSRTEAAAFAVRNRLA